MIKAKNIYFRYEEKFILKNISLEIEEGSFTALIGANGSGKTTLAKHFNGLVVPDKGSVFVNGIDTKKDSLNARKNVGFVFQNFEDQMVYSVVEEDVGFGLENLEYSYDKLKSVVDETLKKLRIGHLAKVNVNALSQGQKQLVALAGVLAMNPKCIVFDEPTTNLDEKNKKNILDIIKYLNRKDKITIILVTNMLGELKYADEVIVLKSGSVIFNGKKSRLNKKIIKGAGLDD
ncbi:ATP-binding cassette domain-containing protein [Candidatus Woesearchaeota archaeon]|nr:ATP-binding cassette domain-containing protein [Candidatus Woesearchaeota archaeon]